MTRRQSYSDLVNPQNVPQSEPLNERQVENNAGGYVFQLDKWQRLERFLILGSDAPTYYQSARKLTRENAKVVEECWVENPTGTALTIAGISQKGRAPKNDSAIFAVALGTVSQDPLARSAARNVIPNVCRTSTHLFQLLDMRRALGGGWGRGFKRAIAEWYDNMPVEKLAYQVIKYRERAGYTHKRALQLAHPEGDKDRDPVRKALYRWICGKEHIVDDLPVLVRGHLRAMSEDSETNLLNLVQQHRLPWEAIPTSATRNPEVWRAMLPHMGLTALIRNLGKMTNVGAIGHLDRHVETVISRLCDREEIRKSRVHPFQVLLALTAYKGGESIAAGRRGGGLSWDPVRPVVDALDAAFYAAFDNVEPTGRRTLLALDISGSMTSPLMGSHLSCREGAAAMAMVTARTEPLWHAVGFSCQETLRAYGGMRAPYGRGSKIVPLEIQAGMNLDQVVHQMSRLPFGGTDCALPMLYALEEGLEVDTFVVYTDSETWAGRIHPTEALRKYRQQTGISAKLIVVGMTSTGFSIADPEDGGMLDVVGFDAACPALIADFSRG